MVIEPLEASHIAIVGSIWSRMKPGILPVRKDQCVYSNDKANTFVGSACTYYVLVQTLLWFDHGIVVIETLEAFHIPIVGSIWRRIKPGILPVRKA